MFKCVSLAKLLYLFDVTRIPCCRPEVFAYYMKTLTKKSIDSFHPRRRAAITFFDTILDCLRESPDAIRVEEGQLPVLGKKFDRMSEWTQHPVRTRCQT